jgi:hypothetical protein
VVEYRYSESSHLILSSEALAFCVEAIPLSHQIGPKVNKSITEQHTASTERHVRTLSLKQSSARMEKLNRLNWTASAAVNSYGVRIGIRSNDSEALELLLEALPPNWTLATSSMLDAIYSLKVGRPGIDGERPYNLLRDAKLVVRTIDRRFMLEWFEVDASLFVAEMSPELVFVHAGVVGWQGKAIMIPGRSFSGKSTLVAELIKAGATYYSDEFAAIDRHGRVHPYQRLLSIRGDLGEKPRRYRPEEFGGTIGQEPLPLGLVLITEYRLGAKWKPRRLSSGNGILALLANTVPARREPERVFATLDRAFEQASILKSRRGEAPEVAQAILYSL